MARRGFDVATGEPVSRLEKPTTKNRALDPEAQLSEDLLAQFSSGERPTWETNAIADLEFYNGVQIERSVAAVLKEREQPAVPVNVTYSSVDQAVAMLTTNRPRFSVVGREDSDTRTAKIFADLLTLAYDYSRGAVHVKRAVKDYYVMGMGVLEAYHDPNADFGNGLVGFRSVDPLDVYIDPSTVDPHARDAPHILTVEDRTRNQWEAKYPQYREQILTAVPRMTRSKSPSTRHRGEGQVVRLDGANYLGSMDDMLQGINRYSRIKQRILKAVDHTRGEAEVIIEDEQAAAEFVNLPVVLKTNSGEEEWVTDREAVDVHLEILEKTGGVFHYVTDPTTGQPVMVPGPVQDGEEGVIPGSETVLEKRAMSEVIALRLVEVREIVVDRIKRVFTIGGQVCFNGVLPISSHPIVPIMAIHNRNPYPVSPVRIVRPIQDIINKIQSLIVAHMANSTNQKVFVPRGSVDMKDLRSRWGKAGAQSFEYNPELGIPVVVSPPPLPNELYANLASARQQLAEILGIYPMMQGDAQDAPDTFKGTIALDEYGQRRIKSYREDIEQGLNCLAAVMVQMMQRTYTVHRVFRMIEPNNAPREVEINKPEYDSVGKEIMYRLNDVTVGEYDVVVVSGSMLPSNRWAQFDYYVRLYEMGLIDQQEVLKKTEVVDVEGVLNRFSEISRLKQGIMQLQEQVKNLQGDLQTAHRESVQANKALEVEKTKAQLKIVEGGVQKDAEMFNARLQDGLRMAVSEAKSKAKEKTNA